MELSINESREDEELATLARSASGGSAGAFEELVRRVHTRVRRWARRLTRDLDDADVVAQLALLRLHERGSDFEGRSRFATWIYRVTTNVANDRRRRAERRATLLAREARDIEHRASLAS